jgi:hypothetical protein
MIFKHLFTKNLWVEELSWSIFSNLDTLKDKVAEILKNADRKIFASLTGWDKLLPILIV